MNQQKLANALRKLGESAYELADALLDSSETGTPPAAVGAAGIPPPAAPSMPEFPPLEAWADEPLVGAEVAEQNTREYVLSRCPAHDKPWTIKEGGVSKNGKAYRAFWKCSAKDSDGSFCDKKPDASWVKVHDPEKALTAA